MFAHILTSLRHTLLFPFSAYLQVLCIQVFWYQVVLTLHVPLIQSSRYIKNIVKSFQNMSAWISYHCKYFCYQNCIALLCLQRICFTLGGDYHHVMIWNWLIGTNGKTDLIWTFRTSYEHLNLMSENIFWENIWTQKHYNHYHSDR